MSGLTQLIFLRVLIISDDTFLWKKFKLFGRNNKNSFICRETRKQVMYDCYHTIFIRYITKEATVQFSQIDVSNTIIGMSDV